MKKFGMVLAFLLMLVLIFVVSGIVTYNMLSGEMPTEPSEEATETVSLPEENIVAEAPASDEKEVPVQSIVQGDGVLTIVTPSLESATVRYGTKATLVPETVIVSNISEPDVGTFREDYLPKNEDKEEEKKTEDKKETEKEAEKKADDTKETEKTENKKTEVKTEQKEDKQTEEKKDEVKPEAEKTEEKAPQKKEEEKVEEVVVEEPKAEEKVEEPKVEQKPQLNPNIQTSDSGL